MPGLSATPFPTDHLRGVLGAVFCAVEPALSSLEAARLAAELARGGHLALVPVAQRSGGVGAAYVAAARYVAARLGTVPVAGDAEPADGPSPLLRHAGRDDLVVVGAADGGGLSAFARAALAETAAPVLVARPPARGAGLGDRRLVVRAGDGRTAPEIVRMAWARGATLVVLERAGRLALPSPRPRPARCWCCELPRTLRRSAPPPPRLR